MLARIFYVVLVAFVFTSCGSTATTAPDEHAQHKTTGRGYVDSVNNGTIKEDTLKGSPARVTMATIGTNHVHLTYHSPGVKGRIIWGGLVPYNHVWVTGAHTATKVTFGKPVTIAGNKVGAGTYAIFTIPGEKEWRFLLNKNHTQHLADEYAASEDILNIPVTTDTVSITPRLTYVVQKDNDTTGSIHFSWERKTFRIPFINTPE